MAAAQSVVIGEDGLARCPWGAADPASRQYHDTEWGVPVRSERALYERITLEAFQAGLSWLTILNKRPAFRAAFHDFDPDTVAGFGGGDIERLMADAGIVRNRAKVLAAITNARATVALREHGGLSRLIWSEPLEDTPPPHTPAAIPTQTPESKALAANLRAHGFVFVGPTTGYALMQAIGLVDSHLFDCHRRGRCAIENETP
jgi:DNA-3-methyladenine glycosylase I